MSRRERVTLWAIVAAAALLRLAYGLIPRVVRWDEAGHLLVASNLVWGRGYSELAGTPDVHLPPFLPVISAGLLKLGFSPAWATATIHIVTGALLCIPIFLLGRSLYSRRVGLIAAALVAVYPALAAWPYLWSTMTESPFLLFVFSGVWAVWRALHAADGGFRTAWYAAVGACFGLAYLVRPEGLTYFAVLGLFLAGGKPAAGACGAAAQARRARHRSLVETDRAAGLGRCNVPAGHQPLRDLPSWSNRALAAERQGRIDPRHCAGIPGE